MFHNKEDIIGNDLVDSRDVDARIKELNSDSELKELNEDELIALQELKSEFDDDTFEDGITFIRDDFFADMAYDDFSELNDISRDAMSRIEGYIDFDAWERDLRIDYGSTNIGSVEYLYRL